MLVDSRIVASIISKSYFLNISTPPLAAGPLDLES